MKLVLSRKGFDSSKEGGGVPSPIFPNGRLLSLPIPDKVSPVAYERLCWPGQPAIGDIVEQLTGGRVNRQDGAHIDPDIFTGSLLRAEGWRPIFGQTHAAQGHLKKQDIKCGDVFLFFGLFREVELKGSFLGFASSSREKHVIFGWLQVGKIVSVDSCRETIPWARYHPHMHLPPDPLNTLYVASDSLSLPPPYGELGRPGAGVFDQCCERLRLTAQGQTASRWLLPAWFAPDGEKPPLTYHSCCKRWGTVADEKVALHSVSRGQEFVLDCDAYPEARDWLAELFHDAPPTRPAGSSELSAS